MFDKFNLKSETKKDIEKRDIKGISNDGCGRGKQGGNGAVVGFINLFAYVLWVQARQINIDMVSLCFGDFLLTMNIYRCITMRCVL